jgi:hypothetical protein
MYITGLGVSEEDRTRDLQEHHISRCEKDKEYLMNYSMCYSLSNTYERASDVS